MILYVFMKFRGNRAHFRILYNRKESPDAKHHTSSARSSHKRYNICVQKSGNYIL